MERFIVDIQRKSIFIRFDILLDCFYEHYVCTHHKSPLDEFRSFILSCNIDGVEKVKVFELTNKIDMFVHTVPGKLNEVGAILEYRLEEQWKLWWEKYAILPLGSMVRKRLKSHYFLMQSTAHYLLKHGEEGLGYLPLLYSLMET